MTKKTLSNNISLLSISVALALTAGAAQASLGNLGTTFGLSPVDIASAQSFSLFSCILQSISTCCDGSR
ncbi:hypothetical protein ACPSKX_01680 [Moritella viscosa]